MLCVRRLVGCAGSGLRPYSSMHGVEVTAGSQAAVDAFEEVVLGALTLRGDPVAGLKNVVEGDGGFPLVRSVLAGLLLVSGARTGVDGDVRRLVEEAKRVGGTPREVRHTAAAEALLGGQLRLAAAHWEACLLDDPLCPMTSRLLHDVYLALGDAGNLRDSMARVMPRWDASMPAYCQMVGLYAFACAETGAFDRAEELAMRNLHMDPSDTWSVHTMAHVFDHQCRRNEGLRFMREMQDCWEDANLAVVHLQAHWALFSLEDAEFDKAMRRYDALVRAEPSTCVWDLIDASQVLWRLELQGNDVGARWEEVANEWEASFLGVHASPFADVHMAMALVAAGHDDALVDHMTSMRDFGLRPWCDPAAKPGGAPPPPPLPSADDSLPFSCTPALPVPAAPDLHWWPTGKWQPPTLGATHAPPVGIAPALAPSGHHAVDEVRAVAVSVGAPLCEGLIAYRTGDYETATEALLRVQGGLQLLGGTAMDRDVFHQTLAHAATQSGSLALARAVLSQRITNRSASPTAWYHYAGVLGAMGHEEEAAAARDQAYVLGLGQHGTGAA